MSPYYFVKILENFTKNFELRIYFLTISMREPKFTNFGVENMEDKFLDGMVDASITMMKRLSEGGTLTPDELKFILLTKQMSEKAKLNVLKTKDIQMWLTTFSCELKRESR